jgi:hypothetical protein
MGTKGGPTLTLTGRLTASRKFNSTPLHSTGNRRQFELEFWSLESLAVWLDQEEELVQEEFKELPVLSNSC